MPQLVKAYLEFRSNTEPKPTEAGSYLVAVALGQECFTCEAYWDMKQWYPLDPEIPASQIYAWTHTPVAPAPWLLQ